MGQKGSCFDSLRNLRRRRRQDSCTVKIPLDSITFVKGTYRDKRLGGIENMSYSKYEGASYDSLAPEIKPEVSPKKARGPPNFEVKDGTLIVAPETKEIPDEMDKFDSKSSLEIRSAGFDAQEEFANINHIPSNPEGPFLENEAGVDRSPNPHLESFESINLTSEESVLNRPLMNAPKKDEIGEKKSPEIPLRSYVRLF